MNYHSKTKEELKEELKKLNREYVSLKKSYEKEIHESEERYRMLFENSRDISGREMAKEQQALLLHSIPLLIYCAETPSNFAATWISENVNRVTGFGQNEFLGKENFWSKRLHPDDRDRVVKAFNELQENEKIAIEYRWQCANDEYRWFLDNICSFKKNPEGKLEFTGVWLDITDRRQAEEILQESEERYRRLVEGSPDAIAVHFNGKFIFVNPAGAKLIGTKSPQDLIGTPILDVVHPDSRNKVIDRMRNVTKGKDAPLFEEKFMKADGSVIDVEVVGIPYPYLGQIATQVVVRDITERKLAEKTLKNLLSLTEATLDSIHNGILVISNERTVIKTNAKFAEMWHIPADILNSGDDKTLLNYVLGQLSEPDAFIKKVEELYEKPEAESFDLIYFRDGRIFERISKPMYLGGEPKGRVWSFHDITERKKGENNLRQSLEWQQAIFEGSRDAIFISDEDSRFVAVNKAACSLSGYSMEQLLRMKIPDLHDQSDMDAYMTYHQRIFEGDEILSEAKILRRDGIKVDTEFNNRCVFISGMKYMHTTARDITDRKLAERTIKEEEYLRNVLLDNLPIITLVLKKYTREIVACNRLAIDAGAVIGKTCYETLTHCNHNCPFCKAPDLWVSGKGQFVEAEYIGKHWEGRWMPFSEDLYVHYIIDITERKKSEEQLRKSKELLENLNQRLYEIRENERAVISREIHDELGQSLTALKLDLNQMFPYVTNNFEAAMKLGSMIELISNTIKDVQRISSELRPGILDDLGLVSAIEWYCEEFEKRSRIKCNLKLENSDYTDPQTDLTFFRVLQEALTNVIRHAEASSVDVMLRRSNKGTTMVIHDNGIGIPVEKIESSKSMGLINIRERVKQFRGKADISSKKGAGTKLTIFIPCLINKI